MKNAVEELKITYQLQDIENALAGSSSWLKVIDTQNLVELDGILLIKLILLDHEETRVQVNAIRIANKTEVIHTDNEVIGFLVYRTTSGDFKLFEPEPPANLTKYALIRFNYQISQAHYYFNFIAPGIFKIEQTLEKYKTRHDKYSGLYKLLAKGPASYQYCPNCHTECEEPEEEGIDLEAMEASVVFFCVQCDQGYTAYFNLAHKSIS